MKITSSKLKDIIKEELEAFLEQKSAAGTNMEHYIALYPFAKSLRYQKMLTKSVKLSAQVALNYVKQFYLNNFDSFRRLVISVPSLKGEPEAVTKKKWKQLTDILKKELDSTPVEMFYDKKHINKFTRRELEKAHAMYQPKDKTIYVNPFRIYKFAGRGNRKGLMAYSMREEYIHRAQHVLEEHGVPTHRLVWSAAKRKNIFLPWKKTGLEKADYEYYAQNPAEFHAKLLQLKLLLRKTDPRSFDPKTNQIKPAALLKYMNMPGEEFMVLKMLDPKKINQISVIFDTIAKASPRRRGQSIPA